MLLFAKDLDDGGLHFEQQRRGFRPERQTEAQGGFEGESHCWTDPIRLEQDKQLGVDALCPRLL